MTHRPLDTLNVKDWLGTAVLGSREQGRQLRQLLTAHIQDQHAIRLDFQQVEVMTSAFADECFGKLWASTAHTLLTQTIHLTGLTGNNHAIFRFVLAQRA